MNGDLDLLRAYVEGTLSAAERAAFEARLKDDAPLAELVEAYAVARDATEMPIAPPATRFEDLKLVDEVPLRVVRRARWLRLAAAAVLLVAVAAGWIALRKDDARVVRPERATVALRAIPLEPLPEPARRVEWPRELLTDRLTDDEGHLVWRRDLESARRLAHALGRPLLLFVEHETCPYCKAYRADVFTDRVVVRAAEPFVLVSLFWNECPQPLMRDPRQGWPLFHLIDSDLERLGGFENFHDAHAFVDRLQALGRVAEESGRFPMRDRERVRAIAERLDAAERAERLADRWKGLRAVVEADPDGDLGAAARARLEDLRRDAQAALFAARDGDAATLDGAVATYVGTPYGEDLERVRAVLSETGAFPRLEEE